MNFVVDLILVLIVAVCAWYGHKKGFILSFFNFFGGLISFVLGSFLARPLGAFVSDSVLKPFMTDYISIIHELETNWKYCFFSRR